MNQQVIPQVATPTQPKERASSGPVRILAILAIIWVVLVLAGTFLALGAANGAPQEAAASAMGMFFVVTPYVLVRFVKMLD